MTVQPTFVQRSLYHGWLPRHPLIHKEFLRVHAGHTCIHPSLGHKPAVQAFADAIHRSRVMTDLFDLVFDQVNKDSKWESSDPNYRVRDFNHLLDVFDTIIDAPPKFYKVKNNQGEAIGEPIGVPIYLVLDLLSNTSAAHDLFRMDEFNVAMKELLNSWAEYLNKEGSNTTLNSGPEGWYSEAGMALLTSGLGKWSFDETYQVDPSAGERRFKSWDDFFVRRLRAQGPDGKPLRPIHGPGVLPVLYNACESTVFRTATSVKLCDTFWLKGQNYSLYDMLGGKRYPNFSKFAKEFVGGSVYQAFLAPQDYHRWHSPIKGRVTKTQLFEGTYYAVLPDDGAPDSDPDLQPGDPHGAMVRCQAWLSVAATRAGFIIEPTDPNLHIKKACFLAVGMVEVSTCQIVAQEGTEVEVGSELGTFHFGGSTYVLIVQPEEGYEVLFQDIDNRPIRPGQHRWIHSIIGHVQRKRVP